MTSGFFIACYIGSMVKKYASKSVLIGEDNSIIERYQKGESTLKIAKSYETYTSYINDILKKNNIPRRTMVEINANHTKFDDLTMEHINGWLLGDGSVFSSGVKAHFEFVSKHDEYANYVKNIIEKQGLAVNKYLNIEKTTKAGRFMLKSRSTIQLAEIRKKWYPNGKKIVPEDLKLTSTAIRNWIMDDGTVHKKWGYLRLCTCGFTVSECEVLSDKLNKFIGVTGINVIEKKKHPRIFVSKKSTGKLLNKIGSCEVKCFDYKWSNNQNLNNFKDLC